MASLQNDLSTRINLKVILDFSNIEVKGLNPERIPCPACRCDDLLLYADPRPPYGGRWFQCRNCGVTGDSVKLGMMTMGESDYRVALLKMTEQNATGMHVSELTNETIETYKKTYVEPQLRARELFEELSKSIYQFEPQMVTRRQRDHLYVKASDAQFERWSRLIGGGTRQAIHRVFGRKDVLPPDGHATNLLLKYQDVPGRIATLSFLGDHGNEFNKFYADPFNIKNKEGGLAMLDLIEPFTDTVFAMDDYLLGLQMHKQHFVSYHDPLPLLLFNARTERAWESVHANRVVLFSRTLGATLFKQAKKIKNALITLYPFNRNLSAENLYKFVIDNPPSLIMDRMVKHARPWMQVLGEYLVDDKTGEFVAADLLNQLNLGQVERDQLFDSMPSSARATLERLLGDMKVEASANHNGKPMVLRSDGFFVKQPGKGDELFADCHIKIDRCTYDPDTKRTFWDGVITYKENQIRFREDVDVIRAKPAEWLRQLTKPYGTVQLSTAAEGKSMFQVMQKMCKIPAQTTANSRIGVKADTVVFPNFTIKDGAFLKEETWVPETAPARDLYPPLCPSLTIDPASPTKAVYAAITAAFIANLIAIEAREAVSPVFVTGGPGSAGSVALRYLASAAGMTKAVLSNSQQKTIDKLREGLNLYGYPTHIETVGDSLLGKWPIRSNDHMFMDVNAIEAAALGVSCNVVIVNGNFTENVSRPLPDFRDTLYYMADLTKRDFHIASPLIPVDGILQDMCTFWTTYYGHDQAPLYAMARRLMYTPLSPGDALIELFCSFYNCGALQISRETIDVAMKRERKVGGKGIRTFYIDDLMNLVYLPRNGLVTACGSWHVPVPDLHSVTQDLIRRGKLNPAPESFDGWVLSKGYWDEACLSWTKRNVGVI